VNDTHKTPLFPLANYFFFFLIYSTHTVLLYYYVVLLCWQYNSEGTVPGMLQVVTTGKCAELLQLLHPFAIGWVTERYGLISGRQRVSCPYAMEKCSSRIAASGVWIIQEHKGQWSGEVKIRILGFQRDHWTRRESFPPIIIPTGREREMKKSTGRDGKHFYNFERDGTGFPSLFPRENLTGNSAGNRSFSRTFFRNIWQDQ